MLMMMGRRGWRSEVDGRKEGNEGGRGRGKEKLEVEEVGVELKEGGKEEFTNGGAGSVIACYL